MVSEADIPFDFASGKSFGWALEWLDFPRFAQGACDWGLGIRGGYTGLQTKPMGRRAVGGQCSAYGMVAETPDAGGREDQRNPICAFVRLKTGFAVRNEGKFRVRRGRRYAPMRPPSASRRLPLPPGAGGAGGVSVAWEGGPGMTNKANCTRVSPGGAGRSREIRNHKLEIRKVSDGLRMSAKHDKRSQFSLFSGLRMRVACETKPIFGSGGAGDARQCVRHRQAGACRCHPGRGSRRSFSRRGRGAGNDKQSQLGGAGGRRGRSKPGNPKP